VRLTAGAAGAAIHRGTIHIRRSTLTSPDAARLIRTECGTDDYVSRPGATHFSLSDAQVVAGDGAFLVAYLDEVASAAVRRLDETSAEIKRMYVNPSVRPGHRALAIQALEREAQLLTGITTIVLETGTRLASAIRLYEAMGTRASLA